MKLLTDDEVRLLTTLALGNTAFETANVFEITRTTLYNNLLVIRRKLGARNTTHAVYLAMKRREIR